MSPLGLGLGLLGLNLALALRFVLDRSTGEASALWQLPLDDAWIHLVYARSLSVGLPFHYNPGQPEAGFSSPLWELLLVPAVWIGRGDPGVLVLAVKATGVLVATAACIAFARLAQALTGLRGAAWLAGALVALDPWLSFARVSGMEVWLAAGATGAALLWLHQERPVAAGCALAAALWARPENALAVAVCAPSLVLQLARLRAPRGAWAAALGLAPLAALAWVGFDLAVTGRPLPNTFYAKANTAVLAANLPKAFGTPLAAWNLHGAGLGLWAVGALVVLRRALERPALDVRLAALAALAFPWLWLLGIAWSRDILQAEAFYWNRYLEPATPFLLMVIACGIAGAAARLAVLWRAGGASRGWALAAGVPLAALTALALARLPAELDRRAALYAGNAKNIGEVQVALGRWVREQVPTGEWVLTGDAGAIRFFGDHPVLDFLALNYHPMLEPGGLERGMREHRPRYWIVFDFLIPGIETSPRHTALHRARAEPYTICDCPAQQEMVVYKYRGPW